MKLTTVKLAILIPFLLLASNAFAGGTGTLDQLSQLTVSGGTVRLASTTANFRVPSLTNKSCVGTDSNGVLQAGTCGGSSYPFPLTGNATSTLTQFNGGLTAYASSTIGNGTQTGGLTISGGATTTLAHYAGGFFNTSGTTGGYQIDNNLILQASTTNSSTLVGQSAGSALLASTSAAGNTALGFQSLQMATSSSYNTAVGYQALLGSATISNAGFNTAVGYQALSAITSGLGQNVAVGYFAGKALTTASGVTAVGYNAGKAVLTGSNGTFVGTGAGGGVTTGSSNTGVGQLALGNVTQGSGDTALGAAAFFLLNTTSSSSTALGFNAGRGTVAYVNTGSTYIGANAALSVGASADFNVAVGTLSGAGLTNGYDNTLFGAYSGWNVANGFNNTLIGWNALATSSTSANFLNIDNLVFGLLPATTSATTFTLPTSGAIGIGSSSPYAKLSVHLNNGDTAQTAFAIGSSTATATTTLFSVSNTGVASTTSLVIGNVGSTGAPSLAVSAANTGFYLSASNQLSASHAGSNIFAARGNTDFRLSSGVVLQWASGDASSVSGDTGITRLSAGVLGFGTGASGSTAGTIIANKIGVGTSTPYGQLAVSLNDQSVPTGLNAFLIASSTSSATTTLFSISNTGNVAVTGSTTIAGQLNAVGGATFGSITVSSCTGCSSASFPFTPTTSFGAAANSTSTLLLLTQGLSASSTVSFGNTGGSGFSFNSATGRLGLGTTTPFAQLTIFASSTNGVALPQFLFAIASSSAGVSSTTLFAIDNTGTITTRLGNALVLSNGAGNTLSAYGGASACSAGQAVTALSAVGGTTCASFSAFSYPFPGNATTTLLNFNGNASTTQLSAAVGYFNYIQATSSIATSSFSGSLTVQNVIVGPYKTPGFTITASTTVAVPFVGSTTPLALPSSFVNEKLDGVGCYTDTGTLNVVFGTGSASTTLLNASTTQNFITFTTNNSFNALTKWYVVVGTPASSPTSITCTLKLENTSY